MAALISEKPATVATVNRLPKCDQLGGQIGFEATAPHIARQVARLIQRHHLTPAVAATVALLHFVEARA